MLLRISYIIFGERPRRMLYPVLLVDIEAQLIVLLEQVGRCASWEGLGDCFVHGGHL